MSSGLRIGRQRQAAPSTGPCAGDEQVRVGRAHRSSFRPDPVWSVLSLERVVDFEPMIDMVDSRRRVYIARGVEKAGEPTEKDEAAHMVWV
ncbi:hypothetical protein GCM10010304_82020 [Streptomyces roseoviolaceus]